MPLKQIFRLMLMVWSVLLALLAVCFSWSTDTGGQGGLFAFIFHRLSSDDNHSYAAALRLKPELKPAPVAEPEPSPSPAWQAMPQQADVLAAAKGRIDGPQWQVLTDGTLEVIVDYSGESPGHVHHFKPENARGVVLDLFGQWEKRPDRNYYPDAIANGQSPCVQRLQFYWHHGFMRFTALAGVHAEKMAVNAEYNNNRQVRVRFTCQQNLRALLDGTRTAAKPVVTPKKNTAPAVLPLQTSQSATASSSQ